MGIEFFLKKGKDGNRANIWKEGLAGLTKQMGWSRAHSARSVAWGHEQVHVRTIRVEREKKTYMHKMYMHIIIIII